MTTTPQPQKSPLGRGLSALFGDEDQAYVTPDVVRQPKQVPVEFLHAGAYQPRRTFDTAELNALADSVREKGVLQPILVRPSSKQSDSFEIIAGERRWRAAQMAGLHEVPVIVRQLTDQEALEIGIIENVQRQDLNPIEEAEGYKLLMDEFGHTQEQLARVVGKSRSHVANMLRLTGLPDAVKKMIRAGDLTAGHARALLSVADPVKVAQDIVTKGLNVRQVENLGREANGKPAKPLAKGKIEARATDGQHNDPNIAALEAEIEKWLGLRVKVETSSESTGTLSIHYRSLDQLDDVISTIYRGVQNRKKD